MAMTSPGPLSRRVLGTDHKIFIEPEYNFHISPPALMTVQTFNASQLSKLATCSPSHDEFNNSERLRVANRISACYHDLTVPDKDFTFPDRPNHAARTLARCSSSLSAA